MRPHRFLWLALLLSALGCHAQANSGPGEPVSPELSWRIETLLRSKAQLPPGSEITVGARTASELPGYDQVAVKFTVDGEQSPPSYFLVSKDNKWMAQFNKYDISQDPKEKVSGAGRPSRGGPEGAPVEIVGFDDLECPFCARLHTQLFPAMLQRYGNLIHVTYLDFPEDQHPWAMRAAVDVNCLAAESPAGYWNMVDYLHEHAGEMWNGDPKTLDKTKAQLDQLMRDEGKRQKVDGAKLDACLAKQDTTAMRASLGRGDQLGVNSTPTLFINGAKVIGAVTPEFIYTIIDKALVAEGKTPPPAPAAKPAANVTPGH